MYPHQTKSGLKIGLILISFAISFSLYAQADLKSDSYFNNLFEVNKEWMNHRDICPQGSISFTSDLDRIQLHLNLVIEHLKSNPPANLNSAQIVNRLHLLEGLKEYASRKVFPVNNLHLIRQPYFVDNLGTNCAVGQMIHLSGHDQLIKSIRKQHNYDYIKDFKTEGIEEWANEFGFTIEDLKWIQPTYPPSATIEQVLDGTNGSVNKIAKRSLSEALIIAGEFTELNNSPCLNIGKYEDGQLECLGAGIEGVINDLVYSPDGVYAFGEIINDGEVFPMAEYDGTSWNYIDIPNREEATCTSANSGGAGYQFELAISHDSFPGYQEIWQLLSNNSWQRKAKVRGVIFDITSSSYGRVHAGHLDSVVVYSTNDEIETTLVVNNVLLRTNNTEEWYGLGADVSDTVKVVLKVGGALIFGGSCINQTGSSNICISRYLNSTLQPLFLNYSSVEHSSVNTMAYQFGETFAFGGKFRIEPFLIGTYGRNLATYNLVSNSVHPLALFDDAVNSLVYFDFDLYIGGDFKSNLDNQETKSLARQVTAVGTQDLSSAEFINVYPNPFTTSIFVEGTESEMNYTILNIDGRTLRNGQVKDGKIDGLDFLNSGVYLLQLHTTDGIVVRKIVK